MTVNFAWQGKYTEAVLELNRDELPQRIEAAERAIYQRMEDLKQPDADSGEELRAMQDALRMLRVLAKSESRIRSSPERGRAQSEAGS